VEQVDLFEGEGDGPEGGFELGLHAPELLFVFAFGHRHVGHELALAPLHRVVALREHRHDPSQQIIHRICEHTHHSTRAHAHAHTRTRSQKLMAWPWLGHEVVYVTGRVEFGFEEERGRLGVLEVAELGQAHLERRHVGQRFAQQPGRLQPAAHNASRTLVAQRNVEEKRKKRKEKGEKNSTSG
jgi:hypothetical protein